MSNILSKFNWFNDDDKDVNVINFTVVIKILVADDFDANWNDDDEIPPILDERVGHR